MGFDLSTILSGVSDFNTERKQIEYIDIAKLHPDERNKYELSDIDGLVSNIELFGLQQPIEVRPHESQDGEYTITSGHRRHAALTQLIADGHDELREVPCIVVHDTGSAALQELRLIYANSDTRRMSPAEQAWQAERIENLLYELKEQGYEFPGRMRDHVAAITKMSASKLARLKAIRNNLKPEGLRRYFEDGRINEATAYELSKRSEAVQDLADEMPEQFACVTTEEAIVLLDGLEKEAEEDKKFAATMQKHLGKLVSKPVSAADMKKRVSVYEAELAIEDQKYMSLMSEALISFIRRLPDMGANRYENISEFKLQLRDSGTGSYDLDWNAYGNGVTISSIKRGIKPITRTWAQAYDILAASAINQLRQMSREKKSKINTAVEWHDGEPKQEGKYYCKLEVQGSTFLTFLNWSGAEWLMVDSKPIDNECTVLGWWPIPEG